MAVDDKIVQSVPRETAQEPSAPTPIKDLAAIIATMKRRIAALEQMVPSRGILSAGGQIGRIVASGQFVFGWPVPTGAVMLVHQVGGTPPPGWLLCDGAQYGITDYPALYQCIGESFGTPASTGRFKVPSTAQLPSAVNSLGKWYIRT